MRDTIAAVFRQRAYDRDATSSLTSRLFDWLASLFRAVTDLLGDFPLLGRAIAISALALVVIVVGRAIYVAALRADAARALDADGGRRRRTGDPWTLAQALAAEGNYTDAAHELYRALLETVARRERIRLHPSKTVGDYVRELRQHSSALFARFRDFARVYEVVIYGVGTCDRERWERLRALAVDIVGAGG